MNRFILINDYQSIATTEDLNILSDDNSSIIDKCGIIAIDEASGYLSTKYDLEQLFLAPVEFNSGDTESYDVGDRIYTIEGSGDTAEYTHYSCIATGATSGTEITDTTYFTEGDVRDQKLLEVVMSISLFYIHKRLSPNNIPLFRVISYDGNGDKEIMSAIKWLQLVQSGELFPYGWPLLSDQNIEDPEVGPVYDKEGNDPSMGFMWGNDMGDEYHWYNNLVDKNIKIAETDE